MTKTAFQKIKAFTLLEISIVLVLISVVAGGALVILTASVKQSQYNATVATMAAIDDALLKYRIANNRLPCPGDLTLPPSNVGYGLEAGTLTPGITAATVPSSGIGNGTCVGTISVNIGGTQTTETITPNANFYALALPSFSAIAQADAVEGAVPVRTLKLPDSYMYDGWGNHIRYAVDMNATGTNTFLLKPYSSLDNCSSILVTDINGSTRTLNAIYVLISQGANAAGAFSQNGILSAQQTSNLNEQANCHFSGTACAAPTSGTSLSTGTAIAYDTYVLKYVQQLPAYQAGYAGNSNYYFDDIVTYKERWQLQSPQDSNPQPPSGNGLGLVLGGNDGNIYPYQVNNNIFTYISNMPTTQPGNNISNVKALSFSPDNAVLGVGGTLKSGSSAGWLYSVGGGIINYPPLMPINYSLLPGTANNTINNISFSPSGRQMAIGGSGTLGAAILIGFENYFVNGGYSSANSSLTGIAEGGALGLSIISQTGKYWITGVANGFQALDNPHCSSVNATTYMSSGWNTQGFTAISTSNDDKYIAVAATNSGLAQIALYKYIPTTSYVPVSPFLTITVPGTQSGDVKFSHNGNLIAITTNAYPYLYLYTNNRDDTFTALSPITVNAGANAAALAWSRDDQFLAVANGANDTGDITTTACGVGYHWCGLALYQVLGTTVNPMGALANPPGAMTGSPSMTAVAFPN